MSTVLEARDIDFWIGSRQILRSVSLSLAAGEFVSILGPSGCGKTVLLKTLCGVESPRSGVVTSERGEVKSQSAAQHGVVMVWQSLALFPHMTVGENVAFGLQAQGLVRAEIESRTSEALRAMQLSQLAGRDVRRLSGGEAQRVAVARAIALRPRVLLLDEPTRGLDPGLRREVFRHVKNLNAEMNIAILMVTHDVDEALLHSNRIIAMKEGRALQAAPPDEMLRAPNSAAVARLFGRSNLFLGTLRGQARGTHAQVEIAGLMMETCPLSSAPTVIDAGASVALMIQPEDILIDRAGGADSLHATIESIYRRHWGNQILLYSEELGLLRCEQRGGAEDSHISVGERVKIHWRRETGRLLPLD